MSAGCVVFCTVQYSTQDLKIEKICLDLAGLSDIKEFGSFQVPVGGEIVITVEGAQQGLFGFQNRNYEKQYSPYDMAMRGGPGHSKCDQLAIGPTHMFNAIVTRSQATVGVKSLNTVSLIQP